MWFPSVADKAKLRQGRKGAFNFLSKIEFDRSRKASRKAFNGHFLSIRELCTSVFSCPDPFAYIQWQQAQASPN